MPNESQIREALKAVIDPELRRDIVELEMVRSIAIKDGGVVDVTVSLTTPGCPIKSHFQTSVVKAVTGVEGVTHCNVGFDVLSDQEKGVLQRKLGRPGGLPEGALAAVQNVICIGSGKGGVGKSSLTVNLAAALVAEGKRVGVLDADVWGYSIPRMLGLGADKPRVNGQRKIIPLDAHGLKVMSIGFFVKEDEAVVWRGPMLHKALTQFLEDVAWGELDYLLIDLPPGTGDVSMTLSQLLPQAKFVIVTTPQDAAQKVARRSAEMADKVKLEIAGVIENMSGFTTPSGERFAIFGEGGGGRLADELEVPLLGTVPLTMALREQSDAGTPLVFSDPDDPAAQGVRQAARGLVALSPVELPVMQDPAPAAPRRRLSRSACRCRWPDSPRSAASRSRRRGRSRRRRRSAARPSAPARRAPRRPPRAFRRSPDAAATPRAAASCRAPTSGSSAARSPAAPRHAGSAFRAGGCSASERRGS